MLTRKSASRLARVWLMAAALAVAGMSLGARALVAQTGTLTGRVVDAQSGAPVTNAQVIVVGTQVGGAVDNDGRFRLANVPVSAREVRARSIGYQPTTASFSLTSGGAATLRIAMTGSATSLDKVVITGAVGDTRRRAIGNAVSTVNVSDVISRSTVSNITEVLQSKTPGLTLVPGSGSAGTSSNYRLRGAGSLYAGNTPTIYVDGVRVNDSRISGTRPSDQTGNYNVFGQTISSLDAINPNDIESIEVIKGPAAATLYGAEAAAGVIQIITKKGRPGTARWQARFETGNTKWDDDLKPVNYAVATAVRIADTVGFPGFKGLQVGDIISHKAMTEPFALRTGSLAKGSLSVGGGGDRYTYFVSGAQAREEGVNLNNYSNQGSLRGNFSFVPSDKLTFATNIDFARSHVRLPLNDNIAFGLIISSYLAIPGRKYNYPAGLNESQILPEVANTYDNQTRSDRFIIGTGVDYKPFEWLSNKIRVGLDQSVGRAALYFSPQPPGINPFSARASFELDNTKGFLAQGRPINQNLTLNYDVTATRQISAKMVSNSSFGAQYLGNTFRRTDAFGQDLGAVGIKSISSAAITTSGESFSEQKSVGFYVQEQLALRDVLFLTGAVRVDNNSAFGSELNRVFYPKASVSYVISEEPFFRMPLVDDLRLRLAWGQAGNSPGPFDALQSYTTSVVTNPTGTSSALRYGSFGNPNLRPERGNEIEAGFEASFFKGRANLDFTYYNKVTNDALLPVAVPPSTGFAGTILTNLGKISNTGFEIVLTGTPIERKFVSMETTVAISTNKNKLVSFGDERSPVIFGSYAPSQRYQEGFPLGALWAQQVQRDANGKVVKAANGQPILDPVSVYMGPSAPTKEVSLSSSLRFFQKLRLYGLADYKGGNYMFNVKDWRRDRAGLTWETVDPAADQDEVLARKLASQTFIHIQKADFVKLRDLSLSYDLPQMMIAKFADRATITAAGHNLKIWTKYGGADPEINFNGGESTFNRNDSWTVPMTKRYSLSLSVNF
ncbi:MAG: SusC/RagA family TonB-linked outer membrane protein [Gemmatimonadales bacterium]